MQEVIANNFPQDRIVINQALISGRLLIKQKSHGVTAVIFFICSGFIYFCALMCLFCGLWGLILFLIFGGGGTALLCYGLSQKKKQRNIKTLASSGYSIDILKTSIIDLESEEREARGGSESYETDTTIYHVGITYADGTKTQLDNRNIFYEVHGRESSFIGLECYLITVNGIRLDDDIYHCGKYSVAPELEQFCRS